VIFHLFSQYIVKNVPYTTDKTRASIEATAKKARLDIDLPDGDPELANREKDEDQNFVFYDDAIRWEDLQILITKDPELAGLWESNYELCEKMIDVAHTHMIKAQGEDNKNLAVPEPISDFGD
jgi:hypothetical protein